MSKYHYRGPSIDHSLLSPSGHMSKRARKAAERREHERLFAGVNLNGTTPQPTERERLLRHAAVLRDLAERGFRPKYHRKHAAIAEAQAAALNQPTQEPRP